MSSSEDRSAERTRPPSVERVPTLTEVVELAPWAEPPASPVVPMPAPLAVSWDDAAGDDALPYEATLVLPPGSTLRESLPDLPLDLGTDLPSDLPSLAGLSLDSGTPWQDEDLAPLPPLPPLPVPLPPPLSPPQPDPAALVAQVLDDLAPRIDQLFETRLREALAPALQRAADGLVQDAREQLSAALRALVEQAVAHTLQQHGPR